MGVRNIELYDAIRDLGGVAFSARPACLLPNPEPKQPKVGSVYVHVVVHQIHLCMCLFALGLKLSISHTLGAPG